LGKNVNAGGWTRRRFVRAACQTQTWRMLAHKEKMPPEGGFFNSLLMMVDQTAINAGFDFRR
jgi:hypothetical protein